MVEPVTSYGLPTENGAFCNGVRLFIEYHTSDERCRLMRGVTQSFISPAIFLHQSIFFDADLFIFFFFFFFCEP